MESTIGCAAPRGLRPLVLALFLGGSLPGLVAAQEQPTKETAEATPHLRLEKTVKTRQYQGKSVEGEERVVRPGDSLWRILIQEKGLSGKQFGRYLVIVGSLNPQVKKPDIIRVGDTLFIPIRPDEILGIQVPTGKGDAKVYRVKQGDYLYKILRQEFGIRDKREIQGTFGQVKGLNPGKRDWNLLYIGEAILFPGALLSLGSGTGKPQTEAVGQDYAQKLSAQENLHLLEQVMGVLGGETRRAGEEVVPLKEGTVHIDRDSFPVIHNPKTEQRVILDLEDRMPRSIRSKLEGQPSATSVVSVKKGATLHETVTSLLPRLGFQSLPADRPVMIQDGGVRLQVKGEWMFTGQEDKGTRQEVWIISLTDAAGKTPDYLTEYLTFRGMNLKEIILPSSPVSPSSVARGIGTPRTGNVIASWPSDKRALVDAFLETYQIPYSSDREASVLLRKGIRMDIKIDRLFEYAGTKFALFFRPAGDEVKRSLEEKEGVKAIDLDLASVSTRSLIARLLQGVGDSAPYREHRFPAVEGGAKDRLVLAVWGFYLPNRSLFLTDREIPRDLQRFFAEKGLRVVYFQ